MSPERWTTISLIIGPHDQGELTPVAWKGHLVNAVADAAHPLLPAGADLSVSVTTNQTEAEAWELDQ